MFVSFWRDSKFLASPIERKAATEQKNDIVTKNPGCVTWSCLRQWICYGFPDNGATAQFCHSMKGEEEMESSSKTSWKFRMYCLLWHSVLISWHMLLPRLDFISCYIFHIVSNSLVWETHPTHWSGSTLLWETHWSPLIWVKTAQGNLTPRCLPPYTELPIFGLGLFVVFRCGLCCILQCGIVWFLKTVLSLHTWFVQIRDSKLAAPNTCNRLEKS